MVNHFLVNIVNIINYLLLTVVIHLMLVTYHITYNYSLIIIHYYYDQVLLSYI